MKSFLFVIQSSAYANCKVQELLDVVLITAAFDQKVSLLLLDDAVYHLKKNQQSEAVGEKDIGAIYRSLNLYDIEDIYVEEASLTQRGLSQNDLLIPITLLPRAKITTTFKAFDFILNG
ncbi:MAG: sulfurtransferase complex subunit TusC [Methyloprofundus sp.]|nr:sulfurtransferase complex subunit TusC [Methyloprofundus sp.]